MAQAKQLQHKYVTNTAIPYVTNGSVTAKDPEFSDGNNVLTSIRGYFEKRNGFSTWIADAAFTFSGTVSRIFTWNRWSGASVTLSGAYFAMFSEITLSSTSRVYKYRIGTDWQPTAIHTDTSSAIPFDYVVSNDFVFFANATDMKKYDGTTVTNWGITAPAAAVTFTTSAGSLSPVTGYQWVICFDNSSTGHMSSPSPYSLSTGPQTSLKFTISGNTTSDTQVDKVRFFRTVDGGSIFFEHPSSPITYATWIASGFEDNIPDYDGSVAVAVGAPGANVAPLPNQNNRPTPSIAPVWFANRIWTGNGDTLYYSGFEEIVRGVEEECFPSTNQRGFGKEITALAVAGEFLLIFTQDTIFRIYGDSLATFRMDKLLSRKGAQNRMAVKAFSYQNQEGVAWLDFSNTLWITDGTKSGTNELSKPIRPDIAAIVQASAQLTYHETGNAHWLVLMDGGAGKLRVFDLDTLQWMPPWTISTITAIHSGAVATASYKLMLIKSNAPLAQDANYLDAGAPYVMSMTTNLYDIVDNISAYGIMDHAEFETGTVALTSLKYLTDEDPASGTYTTITQVIDPPNRTPGTALVEKWYSLRTPSARRISLKADWVEASSNAKVYGFAVAYQKVDG